MSDVKLSTLSIILGLIVALPSLFGLINPRAFAEAVRKFSRHTTVGYVLMLLGTAWFLYYVSQETVSDFANLKKYFFLVFGAVASALAFSCVIFCPYADSLSFI